jgi:hypothetical protein
MMKKLFAISATILFVTAGFTGCKQSGSISGDLITVDVTASYPKKELVLQDFLDVEYIPLETSDEFVTSADIKAIGDDIMIFTNMLQGTFAGGDISIFDRSGKGLRKINRYGHGGEEYKNVQDVVIDAENGEMYVNSTFTEKIFAYDMYGNFKRSFGIRHDMMFNLIGNLDRDNLIAHDGYFDFDDETSTVIDKKSNRFLIISKEDGSIGEIPIPYEERVPKVLVEIGPDGGMFVYYGNRELIPYKDNWILAEPSADTIYIYSPGSLKPFIARTPSLRSTKPEVFLFPGVMTDRYYFMQTVKREYNFKADTGFPRTDLIYDREEKAIFECVVYNDDFTDKNPMSLVYEIPMFTIVNSKEVAFMKRLEAFELIEAYKEGRLKGRLAEIAAGLDEEDNAVIMLAKYRK